MALIQYLSRIQFDDGAVRLLPGELDRLGIARPVVVTDAGVRAAGLVDRVSEALGWTPPVYDGVPSNPTEDAVLAALELYRREGCDGFVALGGGSAIDAAKAASILATHEGSLEDYGIQGGGSERIGAVAPVVAIPTTAGTGAEVGRACSVTLRSGRKAACVNLGIVPKAVICDPELTHTLPPGMTAATGMDALSHGIEAYLSSRENPPAGAIALDCVRRCARYLVTAVEHGTNREARRQMLMAALEGGMTFQKGLGAVHAMSHPLGELGLHHGTLNAVLMPAAIRYNAPEVPDKLADLRMAAGLPPDADLAEWVEDLNRRLGMPSGLAAMGVMEAQLPELAAHAAIDHLAETNPRAAGPAEYEVMLRAAM